MWNMAYRNRTESMELKVLRVLHIRTILSENDKQHFFSLRKGYEGELLFDTLTEKLQCECYILNDLLFKVNNTTFQIDSLIIFSGKIHFYEVKNLEGDYYIDSSTNSFYKKPKKEYINPLLQMSRSNSLLRQLLQNIGLNFSIDAQVVFINPEFTLYQAPLDSPIIFPTQLSSYMKKLDTTHSKLNGKDKLLADKLISLHMEENPYTNLPQYEFNQLQKGFTCEVCYSFSISVQGKLCVCGECGHEELVSAAVLRNVNEIKLLFPKMKITTNLINEWCMQKVLKRTIKKILVKNYKQFGVRQWTYYE
ncbi:Nuclease-related domain-containing protein [Bacillus sp. OK048]|nr:Nuclease-related domain-containing protein [Bacillus sp. OK048]